MNSYLFLFTISPVQSFLSQARKTKDLYAGSKILSDLIDKAMNEISDSVFIFPDKMITSKPNRFLAIIKAENDEEVKIFGKKLETIVQDEFKQFASDAFGKTGKAKPENFDNQIDNHLQIHWVALPYDDNKYKESFKEIESTLGAIKNVREFKQLEETGRKCSLCGERNALVFNSGDLKAEEEIPNTNLKKRYFVKDCINIKGIKGLKYSLIDGEGLCAVCFTKRIYEIGPFPSTAKVALMDTILKLEIHKESKNLIHDYIKSFGDDFDEQLFYAENLTQKYFDKQNIVKPDSVLDKWKELKDVVKANNLKLSKYYAVIMFDGDSMGKWLSGVNCKDEKELLNFHRILSNKLGEFADLAKTLVVKPKGAIVYAGGEDFLGFVNLNYLFEILKTLRELFDCKVNQSIKEFKKDNENISFSAGIVVAHYKMPLSEVLKWARQTEKDAKNISDDKNAFDIAVLKGSGEIIKAQFKWGEGDNFTINIEILNELTENLKKDKYSNTFIKNLNSEFLKLLDQDGKIKEPKLVESEIKRLLKNSCMIQKKIDEVNEDFKKRKEAELKSFGESIFKLHRNNKVTSNFLSALNITEFISRHLNGEKNEN
ncbi:MAG: type III-B CRISPR-associated protein Cas10/Cmr2 [Bacteroidetes bacterium]|nr:type III-B CRISPR-associated protein Cas10/Cmr2 [Bacteroidota bacterium]